MGWAALGPAIASLLGSFGQIAADAFKAGVDIGLRIAEAIWEGLKWILSSIWSLFQYDDPKKVFALVCLLGILLAALIAAMAGVGYIAFGSGSVAKGVDAWGTVFSEDELSNGSGGGSSGGGYVPNSTIITNDTPISPGTNPLCGNKVCDQVLTGVKHFNFSSYWPAQCWDTDGPPYTIFYDIPTYCVTQTSVLKFFWYEWYQKGYDNALCGLKRTTAFLNDFCFMDSNLSIYYLENPVNCPGDCPGDSCYMDFTCSSFLENDCPAGFQCCGSSSAHPKKCIPSDESCDDSSLAYPSEVKLKYMPYHCACSSNTSCAGDLGGSTCCSGDVYHDGFCYDSEDCNL